MYYEVYDVTVSGMDGDYESTATITLSLDSGSEEEAQREIDKFLAEYQEETELEGPLTVVEVEFNQEATDEAQEAEEADLRNDAIRDGDY